MNGTIYLTDLLSGMFDAEQWESKSEELRRKSIGYEEALRVSNNLGVYFLSGRGTLDFKWQGWSNGGEKQNPKKFLDQNLGSKKTHAKFPSHKNFQKALNDIPTVVAIRTGPVHRIVFAIHTGFLLNWLGLSTDNTD